MVTVYWCLTRWLYCVKWNNTIFTIASNRSAICNRWFPGSTRVLKANGISIASQFSTRLTDWQRQTDHATRSFTIGGIYLRIKGGGCFTTFMKSWLLLWWVLGFVCRSWSWNNWRNVVSHPTGAATWWTCWNTRIITDSGHLLHYVKIWHHPQNRK